MSANAAGTKKKVGSILKRVGLYVLLIAGALLFTLPFLWMLSTSLKPEIEVFRFPPQWIPRPPKWSNYVEALTILPFDLFFRNTLTITVNNVIGNLVSCSLVAFGFARLESRFSNVLFILLLSTMMVPYQVTIIPMFVLFHRLGWVDTFKPLMVPPWLGYPFFIFILRQFFMTIPLELDDAARIDGCSTWRIYWNIILPLAKPALTTVAVLGFLGNWNDFMGPLIYISSQEKYTLAIGLTLFRGQYMSNIAYLMAASVATVMPVIIIFFFAQRYFIEGMTLTGLKG
ncbi:MAG TPA: carbohydrate ABC transporter permease [Firmicutes bacterium]|nr:carbohydrate ABC transporter permease [Bacillota bacterium]